MFARPSPLLPPFDFSEAVQLSVAERIRRCLARTKHLHLEGHYLELCELPPLPDVGASPDELLSLEHELGLGLPADYRHLLRQCCYVEITQGYSIYGLSYQGMYLGGPIHLIDDLVIPGTYLAIGDYYRFADGDQLFILLDEPDQPVGAYFHEAGPRIEYFAPSVSLASWRMIYE